MKAAKADADRRRVLRQNEALHFSDRLGQLVIAFLMGQAIDEDVGNRTARSSLTMFNAFLPFKKQIEDDADPDWSCPMANSITPEMFKVILETPKVQQVLGELDISIGDNLTLFDSLDADGSQTLDVSELVNGLMKLRTGAEKNNIVATLLATRSTQKIVEALEPMVEEDHALILEMHQTISSIESAISLLTEGVHGPLHGQTSR